MRIIIRLYQRITRGFDDRETWDLSVQFAKWIVPRLKRFKEINNGYPDSLTEKSWDEIIDKMIEGFEVLNAKDNESNFLDRFNNRDLDEKRKKQVQEALELFKIYCRHLWW